MNGHLGPQGVAELLPCTDCRASGVVLAEHGAGTCTSCSGLGLAGVRWGVSARDLTVHAFLTGGMCLWSAVCEHRVARSGVRWGVDRRTRKCPACLPVIGDALAAAHGANNKGEHHASQTLQPVDVR